MNRWSSKNRKFMYMGGILLLLIPIGYLGAPPGRSEGSGGKIAQQRDALELGESTLGNVDPASSTMSLVLLGFRGLAATSLHMEAEELKKTKNFAQLQQVVNSITLLQPHYKHIWVFHAWNLGYNISAECDDVADRWYWLKEGMKFLHKGIDRNQKVPELAFSMGEYQGHKIATADEKVYYRRFFREDPRKDVHGGGPDLSINPDRLDNFLVASKWHRLANAILERPNVEQHRMEEILFVAYPYHCLRNYAEFMYDDMVYDMQQLSEQDLTEEQRTEKFLQLQTQYDGQAKGAWQQFYESWVNEYGRRLFSTPGGKVSFEATNEQLQQLSEQDKSPFAAKKSWQDQYTGRTSYQRFKQKAEIEQTDLLIQARRELAEAKLNFKELQDHKTSLALHESGLKKLAEVFKTNPPSVNDDETLREIAFKGMLIYEFLLGSSGGKMADDFPMKEWWDSPEYAPYRQEVTELFRRVH